MFVVCLTGGIASGKTTVSTILEEEGCVIIDADIIARQVVDVNTKGWRLIKQRFGEDICSEDGRIDRAKLGQIIFADAAERRKLNAITHPLIRREMFWLILKNFFHGCRYVILVSPLMAESRSFVSHIFSEVIVVYCEESLQLERLMNRNKLTEEEAKQRISAQMPIDAKKKYATHQVCLINNDDGVESTRDQVLKLKKYLDTSWRPEIFRSTIFIIFMTIFGRILR